MSRPQGFVSPEPLLLSHVLLPSVKLEEHMQVTWVLSTALLGICLLPEALVSRSVKWETRIPTEGPEGG